MGTTKRISLTVRILLIALAVGLVFLTHTVLAEGQSSDATLSDLTLSDVDLATFASGTTSYTASVANGVKQTTVTPTVSHSGASYVTKLGGVEDTDGTVSLSVGSNVITVEVTAEDGNTTQTYTVTVTRAANTPATGAPVIIGVAQAGQTLTVSMSDIEDEEGYSRFFLIYQWISNDGVEDTDIPGARGVGDIDIWGMLEATYTLSDEDMGKTIKVQVNFTDDADNNETLTSAATAVVATTAEDAPRNLKVSSGESQELAVSWEAPASDGGSPIQGYKAQWKEDSGSWVTPDDVSEATVTGMSHTITDLTDGVAYTVRVLAFNQNGDNAASAEVTEMAVTAIEVSLESRDAEEFYTFAWEVTLSKPAPSNLEVTLWGERVTLSSTTVTLNAGDTSSGVITATPIFAGEIQFNGKVGLLSAAVQDSDAAGGIRFGMETRRYRWFGLVFNSPRFPYDLTATPGDAQLALSWEMPRSNGGTAITGYKVQWKEDSDSWETPDDVSEETVTATSHIITGLTNGVSYTVRVIAANGVGDGDPSTEVTATPARVVEQQQVSNSPATGAPTISGTPQVGQTLTASTDGISDADGLDNVSYRYQWLADDTEIDGATSSTYTLQASDNGKVMKVRVRFSDDAGNFELLTSESTTAVVMGGL